VFLIRALAALLIGLCVLAGPAMTQQAPLDKPAVTFDKRKLLVPPKNADGTIQVTPFLDDPVLWMRDKQQEFYGAMSGAIRKIRSNPSPAAALTLMLLSFGYGVFHAAGPGHGKAVISAWLLATENELRRGIFIAFLSAIIQALTAIAIVSVLLIVVAGVGAAARDVAGVLESTSYAMIAAMGFYLIATAFRRDGASRAPATPSLGVPQLHRFDSFSPLADQTHQHGPDCGCGHAHVPEAAQLKGEWSLAKAFSLAFAVGIRPCTGAILVLVFANALGLYWAGLASTFAMAVGTFITVSLIASLAVFSKKLALRFAGTDDRWLRWTSLGLRLGGGTAIVLLGGLLFAGSLGRSGGMM
jgi:nickel/cobalt transporter (NicO) family protein